MAQLPPLPGAQGAPGAVLGELPSLESAAPSLRARLRVGAWLVLLPLAWALAVWSWAWPAEPRWGDDWAGYLMQAVAIRDGTVAQELALNTLAMQGSDTQIGPYAYPWGLPVLLWLAGSVAGWSLGVLKLVGGLSVAGLVLVTFLMMRMRVGVALALLGTVLACGQPGVLLDAAFLMSDVPFDFLATLAFALLFAQHARSETRPLSWWLTLGAAVAAAAAFAVRSNGAVLHGTAFALLGLLALRRLRPVRELLAHGAAFALASAVLVGAYFAAFPDGSLVHASYLSTDPGVWARRLATNLTAIWYWFPFGDLPDAWKLLTAVPAFVLLLTSARYRPWDTALVGVYATGHVLLLTAFPFDGGGRYYLPLLAPFFLLLALGAYEFATRLAMHGPRGAAIVASPLSRYAPAAVCILLLSLQLRGAQPDVHDAGVDAPLGTAAGELASWIDRHVPPEARVGFFRPRGLRLLTGRLALGISDPRNLDRVDWYVWTRESRDDLRQVSLESLLAPEAGFVRVHDQGPFVVFARAPLVEAERRETATLRARALLE
jgi:hypothetical protein